MMRSTREAAADRLHELDVGHARCWVRGTKDVGVPRSRESGMCSPTGISGPIRPRGDSGLVDFLFNLRDAGMAAWEMLKSGWDATNPRVRVRAARPERVGHGQRVRRG